MRSDAFASFIEKFMTERKFSYSEMVNFFSNVVVENEGGSTVIVRAHPFLNNDDEVTGAMFHFEEEGKSTIIFNATLMGRETKELPISEFALRFAIGD